MSAHNLRAWCPWDPKDGVEAQGTGVKDEYELPRGCWELNLDPPEEEKVFLTTELDLLLSHLSF